MTRSQDTPVLVIVFNRPDKARSLMAALEQVKPTRLYVSADGPRPQMATDRSLCAETRAIIQSPSWPCEVITHFSDKNLGVDPAVESAITWFFTQVDSGIILEDDCIPHPDFFRFSGELLERHRDDERVMIISGNNFQNGIRRGNASYYFSRYSNTWGWATWKRAWKLYDTSLSDLAAFEKSGKIQSIRPQADEQKHWLRYFRKLRSGTRTPWDAKWLFTIWNHDGMVAVPNINMVKNIGFGSDSTHTKEHDPSSKLIIKAQSADEIIVSPSNLLTDELADRYLFESLFKVTLRSKLAYLWRRIMS
jgi:hypothetical protein